MRVLRHLVLGLGAAVALVAADAPTAVVEQATDYATIDWTKGVIIAEGLGPRQRGSTIKNLAIQRRVAMVDAQRHLAEAARGVKVTSETTIEMYELTKDIATTKVDAFLKGFTLVEAGWMADDPETYRVRLAIPLASADGKECLATVILPEATRKEPEKVLETVRREDPKVLADKKIELPPVQEKPVEIPVKQPDPPTPAPERRAGPYTGLVVDLRGFACERAMSPKIVTKEEDEVWGTMQVSREFVLETGIVGYMPNLDMALNPDQSRAGRNPLVVRAIGLHGSFRANAVVADDDAALIKSENGKSKFLDKFKVVFVVDPR
ncbi:MAG: hypothetical protein IT204_08565 [Fimbriimonadaceae bacterium]|nr:hypothetical protein [Fimbriimonadaceae bacterium]